MPRTARVKKSEPKTQSNGNGIAALTAQLWQAAVNLRGSIEPADYKRYVLPIIFLRFLSLRYERRRAELERLILERQFAEGRGLEAAIRRNVSAWRGTTPQGWR